MANRLYLNLAQVANLACKNEADVLKRVKTQPDEIPLAAVRLAGKPGEYFEASNVVAVYPVAAAAIIAALTPKEDATA